jgi:hypothetical protein
MDPSSTVAVDMAVWFLTVLSFERSEITIIYRSLGILSIINGLYDKQYIAICNPTLYVTKLRVARGCARNS